MTHLVQTAPQADQNRAQNPGLNHLPLTVLGPLHLKNQGNRCPPLPLPMIVAILTIITIITMLVITMIVKISSKLVSFEFVTS